MKNLTLCVITALPFLLAACDNKNDDSTIDSQGVHSTAFDSTSSSINETHNTAINDAWIGKWDGPEGTFIEITGSDGNYMITIQDLDGTKKYFGTSKGDQIVFERDSKQEILEKTSGNGTGMKWLAGKSNCLRVKSGEGWCRD